MTESRVCPTIETERLILRPFAEADLDAYHRILSHPDVGPWLHLDEGISRDGAWEHMAVFSGQWSLRGTGQFAIELRETGEFIGRAGPHNPERVGWPGVEVGWTLSPEHWGRGFATEAGRAAVDWCFASLDVAEIFSLILPDNLASSAVAERLGFTLRQTTRLAFTGARKIGVWHLARPTV